MKAVLINIYIYIHAIDTISNEFEILVNKNTPLTQQGCHIKFKHQNKQYPLTGSHSDFIPVLMSLNTVIIIKPFS